MSASFDIITSVVGILSSLTAAVGIYSVQEFLRALKRKKERENALKNIAINVPSEIININHEVSEVTDRDVVQETKDLISKLESEITQRISESSNFSKEEVRLEIDKKLKEVKNRLESIESRFPDNSVIDKMASINDALFAERLENLIKRIDSIESSQLSKWDVAIVVSMVVAGIFAVVGATYAVINFITTNNVA